MCQTVLLHPPKVPLPTSKARTEHTHTHILLHHSARSFQPRSYWNMGDNARCQFLQSIWSRLYRNNKHFICKTRYFCPNIVASCFHGECRNDTLCSIPHIAVLMHLKQANKQTGKWKRTGVRSTCFRSQPRNRQRAQQRSFAHSCGL